MLYNFKKGTIINMQFIVDSLRQRGKIYKKMQEVAPKELGIRNKIKIYVATDINNKFWAIFAVSQKSRILMKDVYKFEEIFEKLVLFSEKTFSHKLLFIDAPLCSKAEKAFKAVGWKIQ